jgi:type I restriction enzyme S subunit
MDNTDLPSLPPGWLWVSLEEIASHKSGVAFKSNDFMSNGVQVIRLGNVYKGQLDLSREPVYLPKQLLSDNFVLKPGDIVVSQTGTRNKRDYGNFVIIPDEAPKLLLNQRLLAIFCLPPISPKYIFYASKLKIYQEHFFSHETGGVNQGNVGVAGVMKGPIPLPPLNEQRRIVAKIEAVKARSQRVKEELEAIPVLLDQFRQSVLAAAFRGDLTADWREKNPDVEPATRVLESLREKRFSQATTPAQLQKLNEIYSSQEEEDSNLLPESWRYIALEKLCDSFQYGTSAKSLASGKVPVLRMGNIQNGEIDGSDLVYTSDEDEIEKYKLKIGDVLFNRTNSPELVGKTGIYRGEHQAIFAGYLIKINNTQELDSEYLNYCLNTGYAKEYCWRVKTDGVSQSNINAQKLGKFELPFCSLEEQREVVRRINSLFLVANRLKQNYKEAKAYLDQLDRSILAKAFRGELVPQDPNDEPASVLLERIRAEREKLDTKKKAKGKTEKKSHKAKPEVAEPKQLSLPGFE